MMVQKEQLPPSILPLSSSDSTKGASELLDGPNQFDPHAFLEVRIGAEGDLHPDSPWTAATSDGQLTLYPLFQDGGMYV